MTGRLDGHYPSMRRSFAVNSSSTVAAGRGAGDGEGVVVWDLARKESKVAFGTNDEEIIGFTVERDLESAAVITRGLEGDVSAYVWRV